MITLSSASDLQNSLIDEARSAGLRYTSDTEPGILRHSTKTSFTYSFPDGSRVKDRPTLDRIQHLAIPPAWENVWITTHANGHLQATGRDARGRKQYRYHSKWREQRDGTKFGHMLDFARMLPKIRRRVARDLRRPGMCREKVLATVVRLLEATVIRVGNDEYARSNHSYGLTTMRNRHVEVKHAEIVFSFRGKSGKSHEITLHNARLAKIIRRCQEMPGQELFSYLEEGTTRHIGSSDVNTYLREITGSDVTAKDFRTWAGTVLAATAFSEVQQAEKTRPLKKQVTAVIESVAKILGNTPTVCRKCYIHPEVIDAYLAGERWIQPAGTNSAQKRTTGLRPAEEAVLKMLQKKSKNPKKDKSLRSLLSRSRRILQK